jgi:NAD(P)-dependent dehydrogenase (short-subunit alcohol dehydrogenase family)
LLVPYFLLISDSRVAWNVKRLSDLLLPALVTGARRVSETSTSPHTSRIVHVASHYAGDLDIKDLQFQRRRYDTNTAYRQSKMCNRMMAQVLADEFLAAQVPVVSHSCHPGVSNTNVLRGLGFRGFQSETESAQTPLFVALDASVLDAPSGQFWASKKTTSATQSKASETALRLRRICDSLCPQQ